VNKLITLFLSLFLLFSINIYAEECDPFFDDFCEDSAYSTTITFQKQLPNSSCNPYFDKECKHKSTINLPFKDTVYWYQQAAEKGNAEAQSGLGMLYFQGKGVKQSDKLAIKWLIESAKQGRKSAQHNLAVMYLEGIGVEKNYKKSFEWFSRAAKQDYAPSQKSLSNFYRKGLGVEKNTKLADTWFERSKMSGPYNDGLSLYKKGDYESAFKLLKPLADNLHNMAMFYIGVMYEYGKGVEMDYDKAIKYYRDPAHQGVPEAQFNLGRLFLGNAVGVDKDVKTAFRWIERSANQGMAQAQYDLALMYHYGEGVAVDAKKAFELFKKSAEQGYADAKNNLSVFYERGIGVDKNAEKAQYWREKSR